MIFFAGMVSVCAGCNGYYPWIASMIAFVAGVIYIFVSLLMVRLKIDDPLDAVAVHAGSGKQLLFTRVILTLKASVDANIFNNLHLI